MQSAKYGRVMAVAKRLRMVLPAREEEVIPFTVPASSYTRPVSVQEGARCRALLAAVVISLLLANGAGAGSIHFVSGDVDTSVEPAATRASLQAQGGPNRALVIVEFRGPIQSSWLSSLEAAGVQLHGYLPDNAYLATIEPAALPALNAIPSVAWIGSLPAAAKRHPALQGVAGSTQVDVTILSIDDAPVARLRAAGVRPIRSRPTAMGWHDTRVTIPASLLNDMVGVWSVFYIEPEPQYQLFGERAAQTAAGNFAPGAPAPVGPGYAAFLAANGLGGGPGIVVQVQDDGLDQGDASNAPGTAHPDILGRIAGIFNATSDPLGDSQAGHGQINAGIIMANATVGTTDVDGYLLGQGLAPLASVYATKIFRNSGVFDLGPFTLTDLARDAQDAGAIISNNSWGAYVWGQYTAESAEFDMLTRDADPVEPGNQGMIYFFSAGNAGPWETSLGSPATAKNVIAVGAAENSDADGTDGCLVPPAGADNLRDIIDFSSRGPTLDGRLGVTVVSVGTHNQGPASTSPFYDGSGVCDQYWPAGQTAYARSSGTSHSSPTAAGAAVVIYELFQTQLSALGHTSTPSPALMKAVITNTATDFVGGSDGAGGTLTNVPNTVQGWGSVNLSTLLEMRNNLYSVDQTHVFTGSGQSFEVDLRPTDLAQPMRITLAWTDPYALPSANPTLVNDLNLVVTDDSSVYLGNHFAGGFSDTGGSPDTLNNLESVFIQNPTGGPVNIRIDAANIVGDGVPGIGGAVDQDFALFVWNGSAQSSAGIISIKSIASCMDALTVRVSDSDLQGNGTQPVTMTTSFGDVEALVLTELSAAPGVFEGTIGTVAGGAVPGSGTLEVTDGDTIVASYDDADDGTGTPVTVTDQASVDCAAPLISNVQISNVSGNSATITFNTSELATAHIDFGLDCAALLQERSQPSPSTSHSFPLTGLSPLTSYFASVTATDAAGNAETDINGGFCHVFHTGGTVLLEDFENGTGGFGVSGDLWHLTTGCLSAAPAHSAPTSFYFGLDATCNFKTTLPVAGTLNSPIFAVPTSSEVRLTFNYFVGTEGYPSWYDQANVYAVVNGSPVLVASNDQSQPVEPLLEGWWRTADIDISSIASNANVGARFYFDSVDQYANEYPGFYVDDVQIFSDATDADGDAVADIDDNCPTIVNPGQDDRNGDGLGDACTPSCDLNADGVIDAADGHLILRIVSGQLPADGLLARADVAPATGGPTNGEVDVADAQVILRASQGQILSVCNPMP